MVHIHNDNIPLLGYRFLAIKLSKSQDASERLSLINTFLDELEHKAKSGIHLKMKLVFPIVLQKITTPDEAHFIRDRLEKLRERRNQRLLNIYPVCSDEFTLEPDFLDASFGTQKTPLFGPDTPIFTFGSCFAHNIAIHLHELKYKVNPFKLSEDLNSPFSNALMMEIAASPDAENIVHWWLDRLVYAEDMQAVVKREMRHLNVLRKAVESAQVMIVTLGNVLDHHLTNAIELPVALNARVVPKFFRSTSLEDVESQTKVVGAFSKAGGVFRMGTFDETIGAIRAMHDALRKINPHAAIIYTLSPVPIDSAIGLAGAHNAVEIDCLSKSTLRTAIGQLIPGWTNTYYFPAFEIVRWFGGMLMVPQFGDEDANARHVSERILKSVYAFFIRRHAIVEFPSQK